jgi:ribosomal protein S18 acetylase RimI-like enzyme
MHESPLDLDRAEDIAALINAAYEEWRRLPRLDIYSPVAPRLLSADDLRRAAEGGDLDPAASRVVWDDGRPVAAVTVGFGADLARLNWLAVAPDCRGRGLGRLVLARAIEAARDRGAAAVATGVTVDSRWATATALLEAAGFVWADPDRCSMTMQMDAGAWTPEEPRLPAGYGIRTWHDGDDDAWTLVKRAVFDDETPRDWWRQVWGSQPDFHPDDWLLCLHGGRAVGIAAAVVRTLPEGGHGCCIEWVGVLEECRGLGLGRALMAACLNHAAAFHPDPMVLVTQRFRRAAVTLYETLGFREVNDYRHYRLDLAPAGDGALPPPV